MNKVFLIGNLTKNPEIREAGQNKVAKFSLAVNDLNKTLFVDVNAWNKLAELADKYLTKGRKVAVVGRLERDEWTTQTGEKRKAYSVTASDIEFLSSKTETTAEQPQAQPRAIDQLQEVKVDDDDMPF